ncbi:MAG TPA: FxsB family cyclophane-forming radical SAM/SPASM peptide maturase, partial [Streptosporangiaceae bacterium]|nr:FxsB family cyclophane-forming radical SAM/SPASM peptide maturase [Streptosporangiaceae bacterium]
MLKVCSRCDLACDHCYVYEHADQSWRSKPKVVTDQTTVAAAVRIAEHARYHGVEEVRVILHGGEPLLAGRQRLESICSLLRETIEPACRLDLRVHTNGVLLDEGFCDVFAAHRVTVGVSLDGDRAANDRHRKYADGRSSYDKVLAALALLRRDRYHHLFAGLLCTIDVRNDPVGTYAALAALGPPRIDFLLPHATWDTPPPAAAPGLTPYADWLIAIYDRWRADPDQVPVRLFEAVIATSRGGHSTTEALGLTPSDLVVIETDGSIEQVDSIKVAYAGAPQTGLDVVGHDLDEAARHPAITARQQGLAGLCATCRECPVVMTCGGGLYAHRYRTGIGFDNPSVYCDDLKKLITHIRSSSVGSVTTGPARPAPQQRRHTIPRTYFAELACGYGDDHAVGYLAAAHLSVTRALLGRVRDRIAGDPGSDAAWEVLAAIDPAVLDTVLAHPYVRAWALRCLGEPAAHAA